MAKKKAAARTNKTTNSLIKCEVSLDRGRWISPARCEKFYLTEDAAFPAINFEIDTQEAGPYDRCWEIQWIVKACPQKSGQARFKANIAKTFKKTGSFRSRDKKWKADLEAIIGDDLIGTVKAGSEIFTRRVQVFGEDPGEINVNAEVDTYAVDYGKEAAVAKKIFKQESRYLHFYSDAMPLVSFDNGYGLGQATNPVPSYEQAWNWKKHIKYIIENVVKGKRALAKKYLDTHGSYTNEQLDTETLVYYNGANAHYYVWDTKNNTWIIDSRILCDPRQSNSGWDTTKDLNKDKTLKDLQAGKGTKPMYTGRCYAEHIKNSH